MSPAERAKAAHAAAEAATDPRVKSALRAAGDAWERVAGPGRPWSLKPLQGDFRQLQRDFAIARGPFQPPKPPKAPSPSKAVPARPPVHARERVPQEATIAF